MSKTWLITRHSIFWKLHFSYGHFYRDSLRNLLIKIQLFPGAVITGVFEKTWIFHENLPNPWIRVNFPDGVPGKWHKKSLIFAKSGGHMRKEGTRHIFCNIVACSGCSNSSVLFRERTFFLRFKRTWVLRKENGALCSIRHILAFEKVHCWRVQNSTPKAGIFPSYTLLQTQHLQSSPSVMKIQHRTAQSVVTVRNLASKPPW